MRVLIPGCTPQHTGKPHPLNYALTSHLVAEGLRASGHQVDQRALVPGEKKHRREYDQAIAFYFNPEATNARDIFGALWTLVEFPRALIGIEDWTVGRIFSNTRRVVKDPTLLTNPSFLKPKYQEEARPHQDRLIAKMDQLVEGRGHHNLALSLFPWSDRARLGIPNHDLLRCPRPPKTEGLDGGARWIRTAGPGCFGRKRPVPASFGSLSAPLCAPEADRRRTGF